MKATAKVKNIRYGVLKLRLVADLVSVLRNKKKGAPIVENALKSAVANFKQKAPGAVTTEELKIDSIYADGATIMKRMRPRSHGSADRIAKPLSHLTVVVADNADKE